MTDAPMAPSRTWRGIFGVWGAAAAGAILVAVFAPSGLHFTWLSITLAACTMLAFVVQLLTHQKIGFIDRLSISVVGILGILSIAAALLGIGALFQG
ncbi:hypothetical protein [Mycetocola miduiensis]|uniref:Uncharacterized protein n=1 Tax=Mycetocola miduiensis TaxID=995034 RepID=A0A1I5DTQ5_9MICO|nr:hypothetical protein [Mycetocola miduiensis]SFO02577.1 hypothetical protein SAMN05216219_3074 [Mycetocola miduiensis]